MEGTLGKETGKGKCGAVDYNCGGLRVTWEAFSKDSGLGCTQTHCIRIL